MSAAPRRIEPRELARLLEAGEDLQLVDVREPAEWAIGHIAGSVLVPRGEIPSRIEELDPERTVVCICHHGIRSAQVAGFLASRGFGRVLDLAGGLERWSLEVDPRLPRYG